MSYSATITDNLTQRIESVLATHGPALMRELADEAEWIFKRHFRELDRTHRNKIGGSPTHFWAQAADSTHAEAESDGVRVSVNQVGVRQRLQGGTISAGRTSNWLTIPVSPQAYGHRAGEFANLRFVLLAHQIPALITQDDTRARGRGRFKVSGAKTGDLMFILKKSVEQDGDPTVIPDEETVRERFMARIRGYFRRLSKGGQN